MQLDGWQQRSCEDFVVEHHQMLGDVRVEGHAMGMESSLSLIPVADRLDQGENGMWGGAFDVEEMPLVDSTGGAGWALAHAGVVESAAALQSGHGGMDAGDQDDGCGSHIFSGWPGWGGDHGGFAQIEDPVPGLCFDCGAIFFGPGAITCLECWVRISALGVA